MEMTSSDEGSSIPILPLDSPGSCISSRLQDEYDELLRYAVVVPTFNPEQLPKTLADLRGSFPAARPSFSSVGEEEEERMTSTDGTVTEDGQSSMADSEDPEPVESLQPTQRIMGGTSSSRQQLLHKYKDTRPDSPASTITNDSLAFDTAAFSVTVDTDIQKMEMILDQWSLDLKKNVLSELSQSKLRVLEFNHKRAHQEKQRHVAEMATQQDEAESLRELLHTYETSIERKDQVITNLTQALQRQRDRYEMLKTFCEWRLRHNDQKREAFASNLALQHYHRSLLQRVWVGWHSTVEDKWRQRVEKACQAKAQEVCIGLTNDYEAKLASANEALSAAREEVARLTSERERYEETMKKAFMRGVCALNMEAMAMFNEAGESTGEGEGSQEEVFPGLDTQPTATTIPQEAVFSSAPPGAPMPRVVTSLGGTSRPTSSVSTAHARSGLGSRTKASVGRGKIISAKVTARNEPSRSSQPLGGTTLAPPMSSVLVERHQAVTKQTIGHATASQYPRGNGQLPVSQPGIIQRKIAGQFPPSAPNVQTVKVVE